MRTKYLRTVSGDFKRKTDTREDLNGLLTTETWVYSGVVQKAGPAESLE